MGFALIGYAGLLFHPLLGALPRRAYGAGRQRFHSRAGHDPRADPDHALRVRDRRGGHPRRALLRRPTRSGWSRRGTLYFAVGPIRPGGPLRRPPFVSNATRLVTLRLRTHGGSRRSSTRWPSPWTAPRRGEAAADCSTFPPGTRSTAVAAAPASVICRDRRHDPALSDHHRFSRFFALLCRRRGLRPGWAEHGRARTRVTVAGQRQR